MIFIFISFNCGENKRGSHHKMAVFQRSIELIDELFENEANGINQIELYENFATLDENFDDLTGTIVAHYAGKIEHLVSNENTGFILMLIRDLYIMMEYERRQNRSYDFTFRSFYFISTAEQFIYGDNSSHLEEEPYGAIEEE